MNFIHVIILSVVEGVTEFLPISSTGHLILTSKLLGIESSNFTKTFEIVIQLGAILAVVVLYSKTLLTKMNLVKKILAAFTPSAILGFILYPLIKDVLLESSAVTLNALFWGGIALILIEKLLKKPKLQKLRQSDLNISYRQALIIGAFQSIAIIPGVSRAAATIMGGLLTGIDRKSATEFSFILAIPTMFAATSLDLYKSRHLITQGGYLSLFVGAILSFFFAAMAVKFLINYVKNHDFTVFGIYRIAIFVIFKIYPIAQA